MTCHVAASRPSPTHSAQCNPDATSWSSLLAQLVVHRIMDRWLVAKRSANLNALRSASEAPARTSRRLGSLGRQACRRL